MKQYICLIILFIFTITVISTAYALEARTVCPDLIQGTEKDSVKGTYINGVYYYHNSIVDISVPTNTLDICGIIKRLSPKENVSLGSPIEIQTVQPDKVVVP